MQSIPVYENSCRYQKIVSPQVQTSLFQDFRPCTTEDYWRMRFPYIVRNIRYDKLRLRYIIALVVLEVIVNEYHGAAGITG
jgi:hypothetical protein